MTDLPFMKLYWQDFLADTDHLSLAELGLYMRVLGKMWLSQDGTVKPVLMDRLTRMPVDLYPEQVFNLLTKNKDGNWTQKRLKRERISAKRRSKAAKEAANRRWDKKKTKNAAAYNLHMRNGCKPEPEPEPDVSPNGDTRPPPATRLSTTWVPDERVRLQAMEILNHDEEAFRRSLLNFIGWYANKPGAVSENWGEWFLGWCRKDATRPGGGRSAADERRRTGSIVESVIAGAAGSGRG